jgi:hypothetical protein
MAAPWNPPVKAEDFEFTVSLADMNTPGKFKSNPTLAAGDVKISKDEGSLANLATLPSVAPASSKLVAVELTGTEMDADKVTIIFSDQTDPPEWADLSITILTTSA